MFEVLVECLHDKLSFLFLIDCYSEVLSVTLISHLLIGSKSLDDLILIICLQKASHLDWLGLLAGLFSVLQIKPEPALSEVLQYHHAVLFRAVCYCFLCCRTALPEHTPSHTLTFAHTRTHMLKLTHAHTPLPMLTFIHTHTGPHTRLHPHTCSHPLIHTGSKLHIQPWSHTTTPWPSGFVSVCFVCLFVRCCFVFPQS